MIRVHKLGLDPESELTLQAVQTQQGLDSKSAAIRFVLAAIAPHVRPGTSPRPAPVRPGPQTKAQQIAERRHMFDLRKVPIEARADVAGWVNTGLRPPDAALQALALSHPKQLGLLEKTFPGFTPAPPEPSRKHLLDLRLVPLEARAELSAWIAGGPTPSQEGVWSLYLTHAPAVVERAFGPRPEPPPGPARTALRRALLEPLREKLQAQGEAAAADAVLFWCTSGFELPENVWLAVEKHATPEELVRLGLLKAEK